MIVKVGDTEYTVTNVAFGMALLHIEKYVTDHYIELPEALKLILMQATRGALLYIEKTEPNKEKKFLIRPPKKTDPTLHLIRLMMKFVMEVLPHAGNIVVGTDEENNVISIGIENTGEGRGQVSANGNQRIGEDDGGEAARPEPRKIISVPSPLHP